MVQKHKKDKNSSPEDERWEQFYNRLKAEIPEQFFSIFFTDIEPVMWDSEKLVISSSDEKVVSHLKKRYSSMISSFAREMGDEHLKIQIVQRPAQSSTMVEDVDSYNQGRLTNTKSSPKTAIVRKSTKVLGSSHATHPSNRSQGDLFDQQPESKSIMDHGKTGSTGVKPDFNAIINPSYTFDRFIQGPSNEFAYAAARGAALNPKNFHNPIYIFGGVGLGKTHLLMAVANHIKEKAPFLEVLYVSSEKLQADVVEAFTTKNWNSYHNKYRNVDILLIDDIQFVSQGADYTQEQIFHMFNHLYQKNKTIIISGDRPPQHLSTLKDRLISRFQSGLIIDIKPPNFETRQAILRFRSEEMGLKLESEVIRFIAMHEQSHVRTLESTLIKMKFMVEHTGKLPDLEMAKVALNDIIPQIKNDPLGIDQIVNRVSRHTGVDVEQILGKSRTEEVALARHMCMYLVRKLSPALPLVEVAKAFARNDHTTVINAEKRIKRKMEDDPVFSGSIQYLTEMLTSLQ